MLRSAVIYFVGCGGILKEKVGTISSPLHTGGYPSETNCKWIIAAPVGYVIQLTWMSFQVESSIGCVYDRVTVYDNNTISGTSDLIGKYCGSRVPLTLLSSNNIITIKFESDRTINLDGFLATYSFINERNG